MWWNLYTLYLHACHVPLVEFMDLEATQVFVVIYVLRISSAN